MLLFQKRFPKGLVRGEVTLTFRRWDKAPVRPGGRYRCHPIGGRAVDGVRRVRVGEITEEDARRSGFSSRGELLAHLGVGLGAAPGEPGEDQEVFRVELRHGGDGDRVEIALDDALSAEGIEEIRRRLARLDARRPFTAETLALIEQHPPGGPRRAGGPALRSSNFYPCNIFGESVPGCRTKLANSGPLDRVDRRGCDRRRRSTAAANEVDDLLPALRPRKVRETDMSPEARPLP